MSRKPRLDKRSQLLRLADIAAEIIAIEAAVTGTDLDAFSTNWLLRSGIERGIERISEASRHLDPDLLAGHPEIPWRRVADIGNWLRHAYENVDPAQIWIVATVDLGQLKTVVAALQNRLSA
jgi:uncharacterized protein with HEPN domain